MSSQVVPLARALADNIPAWRLRHVARWNELYRPASPRRRQQANELYALAKQIEHQPTQQMAA